MVNSKFRNLVKMSLECVPKGPIDNNQVETDRIYKYFLEIKDVLEFKDART